MGIFPSSQLIHPLKHNKLRQHITKIIQTNDLSGDIKMNIEVCFKLLEKIFISVNADESYAKSLRSTMSKLVQIYDYPLLIALPYDRLLLSQFCTTKCFDGRNAQGIMVNGKYYSLTNNAYTPMSKLKINHGSIIQLKFTFQPDTIIDDTISSFQNNKIEINDYCRNVLDINENKFAVTKYQCSVEFDNNAVNLMFPTEAIDVIISFGQSKQKVDNDKSKAIAIHQTNLGIIYLRLNLKSSSNWMHASAKINELKKQINKLSIEKRDPQKKNVI
ncbi:unnamed protein product [Rotaria sp. Silwood2]|nr:unnamed protein product [Rotaria sp. Silwood2]CAF2986029.1 unnamed protein product [Rotaria sp. Silwood2]CAF3072731.1 unnamed protein product [Rotaria sp. Silwood2]CAF4035559.1 unnamed protein product [Rotaria sp. Silwood2]CAF4199649.1 unnamed protein product [Rotaria sp. Silwood2]